MDDAEDLDALLPAEGELTSAEHVPAEPAHPDLQIPLPGSVLSAVSLRVGPDADFVELLLRLRTAGADVVSVNSFPATRGEPGVDRVMDVEFRDLDGESAAAAVRGAPGVVVRRAPADPGPDLRQAGDHHRRRGAGRPGEPGCGHRVRPPQPPGRAHLRGHHRARGREEHRLHRPRRRGPATRPHPRARRVDHGRRHHPGGARAPGDRHPGRSRSTWSGR